MHSQPRPRPIEPRSTATSPHRAVPVVDVAWNPALSQRVPDREIDINSDTFVRAAGRAGRLLDETTYDSLVDFGDGSDRGADPGALLLRGIAVGDIGPTPSTPTDRTAKDSVSEFSLLTVARMLGQPIGYLAEHGGNVVQNICPTVGDATRQTSTSSRVTLGFHTETAFHPHRSRYLLLVCLRGDPTALTSLCCIDEVLPALPPTVRRALWEPRFRTRPDESFGGGPDGTAGAPAPVLSGSWDHPSMVFDAELMSGVDAGATDAAGHAPPGDRRTPHHGRPRGRRPPGDRQQSVRPRSQPVRTAFSTAPTGGCNERSWSPTSRRRSPNGSVGWCTHASPAEMYCRQTGTIGFAGRTNMTAIEMVIDHAHRLHRRVGGGRTDEPKADRLERLRERLRLGGDTG